MSGRSTYSRKRKASTYYKKRGASSKSTRTGSRYWAYDAPRQKFSASGVKNVMKSMMELKQTYFTAHCNPNRISHQFFSEAGGATALEYKGFATNAADTTNPCREILHEVKQGAQPTYDTRIGNKITIKSIDFRLVWSGAQKFTDGEISSHATAAKTGDRVVWIILDKTPNGAAPLVSDIFHSPSGSPYDQKHSKNENRFQILKTFICPSGGYNPDSKNKFMYYKMKKPIQVRYQASTGNISDIVENAIWVLASNTFTKLFARPFDDANLPSLGPALGMSCNIRFYDA